MMTQKNFFLIILRILPLLCSFLLTPSAFSSIVEFSSSESAGASFTKSSPSDFLIPSTTNSAGNSYTKLTRFIIDTPLKIINTSGSRNGTNTYPAGLIILNANEVSLRSSIEIVGETADILIYVSGSTGTFNCTKCSFTNVGRVTLAAASPTFDSQYNPRNLTPTAPTLAINGLTTDRVASMELIGANISLAGSINTQTRGSRLSDGSYQLNPSGSLVIGAGGINVFSGFSISYPDLAIGTPYGNSSLSFNSSTSIASQAVHISTAKPFNMTGTITTKSDVTTAINYRGKISAVEESINIYSFAKEGVLSVSGALHSDKLVDLRSASDLTLSGVINAAGLIAIAAEGKKLMHGASSSLVLPGYAAKWLVTRESNKDMVGLAECRNEKPLKADGVTVDGTKAYLCLSAFLSGGSIENNGSIKGRSVVVAAIGDLQNRYSGKIIADNIQLSSSQGFIRNGSQYPFKPVADAPKVLAPIDPNDIPFGTVTIDDQLFISAQNGAQKVDTSAYIIGKNVILSASGNIENINPYLELTTDTELWRNGVVFSPVKSARVQLIAEDNLKIKSGSYILNSSAYMGVSRPGGVFYASAPSIANQRYTAQAVVQPYDRTVNSVNTKGFEAALMVYSPQGAIYSFATLQFELGKLGSFINNSSYFEVLNNAVIGSPSDPSKTTQAAPEERSKVINIGLNVDAVVNTSVNTQYVACISAINYSNEATSRREYSRCQDLYGGTTVAPGTTVEAQQGTLFAVKGIYDSTSHLQVTNHDVMADMKNDVIANYIKAQPKPSGSGRKTAPNGSYISYSFTTTTVVSANNAFLITAPSISSDSSKCTYSEAFCRGGVSASDIGQPTVQKSIADLLSETFKQMKDKLIELINKLKALLS